VKGKEPKRLSHSRRGSGITGKGRTFRGLEDLIVGREVEVEGQHESQSRRPGLRPGRRGCTGAAPGLTERHSAAFNLPGNSSSSSQRGDQRDQERRVSCSRTCHRLHNLSLEVASSCALPGCYSYWSPGDTYQHLCIAMSWF